MITRRNLDMKNRTKIGIGMMLAFVLICVLVPTNVAAKSGTLVLEAQNEDYVTLGKLSVGDTITYEWDTSDDEDTLHFGILRAEDPHETVNVEGQAYQIKEDVNSMSGTLTIDTAGTYHFDFFNNNWVDNAIISYEYTITKASEEKKDSDDSPGFELFGVALAIGLCIAVMAWKRKK